ncbi:MAG: alpha/beta hydrolase, partial [Candidatus Hadarchaeum sp.]
YTVVAPDLRGYGYSDKPAGGYDKRTMATDIHELVRLVLWGGGSVIHLFNVLEIWQEFAQDVRGEAIPECGHFLPEEKPDIILEKLLEFL